MYAYLCMYIYVYLCMYVCMYSMYVYLCVCMYVVIHTLKKKISDEGFSGGVTLLMFVSPCICGGALLRIQV